MYGADGGPPPRPDPRPLGRRHRGNGRRRVRHPTFESLPLDAKQRVDAACRRFEEAWKTGRPDLSAFLAEVRSAEQVAAFVELLHIDVERRQQAGEPLRAEEYLGRFPDHAAAIRTALGPIAETNPGGRVEVTRPATAP